MNYDLPFLGLDLVTLPGGHLIAIDMQPLFQTEDYKKKVSCVRVSGSTLAWDARHV